jgi:class 3 adenylate cyclase
VGTGGPYGLLIVSPPTGDPQEVPIYDRLYVGREWSGVEPSLRFLVQEPGVSRNHLEIRLDAQSGFASVVDTSTNGTRLNGVRIERGLVVPLATGDRLTVGELQLEFRSDYVRPGVSSNPSLTARDVLLANYVMVVGDIVGFTRISQHTSSRTVLESLDSLFGALRVELSRHNGMLGNLVGDAFFAVWELDSMEDAPERAVQFAVTAAERVRALGPDLGARLGEEQPLRMGWGISVGDAALTTLAGTLLSIVGDAANLAFRLAGLAARDGRDDLLVTDSVCRELEGRFPFGPLERVEVKGRVGAEPVRSLQVPIASR